jgi:hypothetical protein
MYIQSSGLVVTPGSSWEVPQSGYHVWHIGLYALSLCIKSISRHFVQEPCLLRGHCAGSFPSFLLPSPSSFTYFPTFVSSAYKRDLAKEKEKEKQKRKGKEILRQPSSPAPAVHLFHACLHLHSSQPPQSFPPIVLHCSTPRLSRLSSYLPASLDFSIYLFLLSFFFFFFFFFFFALWGGALCSSVRSVNIPQPVISERGVSPSAGYLLNIVRTHLAVATFITEIMVASAFMPLFVWRIVLSVSHWWQCILREFLNSIRATL